MQFKIRKNLEKQSFFKLLSRNYYVFMDYIQVQYYLSEKSTSGKVKYSSTLHIADKSEINFKRIGDLLDNPVRIFEGFLSRQKQPSIVFMRQHLQIGLKKTYKSTPEEVKRKLMYKVMVETRSIKQAAKLLRINYSTAKTIVRQRKSFVVDSASTNHSHNRLGRSQSACLRSLRKNEKPRMQIISSIGEEHIGGLRAGFKQIPQESASFTSLSIVVGKIKTPLA